jgi:hypothetical protein
MDWGYLAWAASGIGYNATGLAVSATDALAASDLANWSSYGGIADGFSQFGTLFNGSSVEYELGIEYQRLNYTANQTEWATFVAECYGVAVGQAGMVAAGSSAACAVMPLTCLPIGAYSMYQNVQAATVVYRSGFESLDPCAETRRAFPVGAAALTAQSPGAARAQLAAFSPFTSLLSTAGLFLVLLASVRARRNRRCAPAPEVLV